MNYIVDDIGAVVSAVRAKWITADSSIVTVDSDLVTADGGSAPYYMYDSRGNIAKGLRQKGKDSVMKFQKYPLIALRLPVPEEKSNGMVSYTLNIGIFSLSTKTRNTAQRYDEVFRPILYPLYEMFFQAVKESGLFQWSGYQNLPEHTKVDRPFWGTEGAEQNEKYIFEDPLDAIEIFNLRLNSRIKTC